MNTIQEKIEFYKPRNFAERLGITFKFIRMNMLVIWRNIALLVVPAAMIQAYFMKDYLNLDMYQGDGYTEVLTNMGGAIILACIIFILVYALTASMITAYGEGELNKTTKINQLKYFPRYILKTSIMIVCVAITSGIFAFLIALISPFLIILLVLGMLVIIPSMSLILFPAYYEDMNVWDSFVKGFKMGFKNWGTTFLMLLLLGVVLGVIQYILFIPYYIWIFVKFLLFPETTHWYDSLITYVTTFIAYLGSYSVMPAIIIGMSFQYFSLREQDEHVSVQSHLEEFENL